MRVSPKLILLAVCLLWGTVFGAAKVTKDANMAVKSEKAPAKEAPAPAPAPIPPQPPAAAEKSIAAVADNDVAVTVNGIKITEAEVDAKIKEYLNRTGKQMPPGMAEQNKAMLRAQLLENIVAERLLDEQIKKSNIKITDSDVNDAISRSASQQGISVEAYKSFLKSQGQSFEQLKENIKKALALDKLAGSTEVNDTNALSFYQQNESSFNAPEQVRVSHIFFRPDPNEPEPNRAKGKAYWRAETVLTRARGGSDFNNLAQRNSDDMMTKEKGGDVGYIGRGQTPMGKAFEDAAFALQPGQIGEIVESRFGYHVIKVTGHRQAGLVPFEEVKDDIVKTLARMKTMQSRRQYIEKLMDEAQIVYPAGKDPKDLLVPPPMRPEESAPPKPQ